jgi:hypothetical protein
VRYGMNLYMLFRRNSVFKVLTRSESRLLGVLCVPHNSVTTQRIDTHNIIITINWGSV